MSIFVVESCDEASSGASAAAPWEHARERKRQHHHSPEATKLKARGRAVNSVRSCCRDFINRTHQSAFRYWIGSEPHPGLGTAMRCPFPSHCHLN